MDLEETTDQIDPVKAGEASPKDYLEYDEFEDPVFFRITTEEGTQTTILPHIDLLLETTHDPISRPNTIDVIRGGLEEEFRSYVMIVFDGEAVSDPSEIIEHVEEIVENANTPPERLSKEGKEEWKKSTVIVTDIEGVDRE